MAQVCNLNSWRSAERDSTKKKKISRSKPFNSSKRKANGNANDLFFLNRRAKQMIILTYGGQQRYATDIYVCVCINTPQCLTIRMNLSSTRFSFRSLLLLLAVFFMLLLLFLAALAFAVVHVSVLVLLHGSKTKKKPQQHFTNVR